MAALRIAARDLPEYSVQPMDCVSSIQEHERALPCNHANSVLLAKCDCLLANRAFSRGAIHPNNGNSRRRAVRYYHVGYRRSSHQKHGINFGLYVLDVCEAGFAENF